MHMLDTNICIKLLNGTDPGLLARLRAEDPASLRLSSITKAELLYGARHSQRVAPNLRLLEDFFAPFLSLRLTTSAPNTMAPSGPTSPPPAASSVPTTF